MSFPLVVVALQPAVGVCQALKVWAKQMFCSREPDVKDPAIWQLLEDFFLGALKFLADAALEDSIRHLS